MKFKITRTDTWTTTIEAESEEQALEIARAEDDSNFEYESCYHEVLNLTVNK